jgi:predicted ATP-dependent serine protease
MAWCNIFADGRICRPLFSEVQSLVCRTSFNGDNFRSPKRTVEGFSYQRLCLICAVIEKHVRAPLSGNDIFINAVGGSRMPDASMDLAVAASLVSSLTGCRVRKGWALAGEIGLRGELRMGQAKQYHRQVAEASRLGFEGIIVPRSVGSIDSADGRNQGSILVARCSTLSEALEHVIVGGMTAIRARLAQSRSQRGPRGGTEHAQDEDRS